MACLNPSITTALEEFIKRAQPHTLAQLLKHVPKDI